MSAMPTSTESRNTATAKPEIHCVSKKALVWLAIALTYVH